MNFCFSTLPLDIYLIGNATRELETRSHFRCIVLQKKNKNRVDNKVCLSQIAKEIFQLIRFSFVMSVGIYNVVNCSRGLLILKAVTAKTAKLCRRTVCATTNKVPPLEVVFLKNMSILLNIFLAVNFGQRGWQNKNLSFKCFPHIQCT